MGIIKKNGLYATVLTYVGLVIGAFNTLFFFPKVLTPEQFGLFKVVLDFGNIWLGFAPLATIGLIFRYNPYYKHDNNKTDFFTWIFVVNIIGASFFVILTILFQEKIISFFSSKSPLLTSYFSYILIFCFLFQILTILETFSAANYKLILPSFLREILNRISQAILILFLFYKILPFNNIMMVYVFLPIISITILFYNLYSNNQIKLIFKVSEVSKKYYKEMIYFSSSLYSGNIFLMLASSLDSILISGLKGLDSAAIFILSNYIVTFISIPYRSISNIATPVLAESWKNNDMQNIKTIYQKSSIILFAISYFLFIVIWLNLDNTYILLHLPSIYVDGKNIVLLLGIAKVVDMVFGLNHELMVMSNYWKQNFYFQVILIIIFIPINYFSILKFGIIGPAISNLILMFAYNSVRTYFIWNKFKLSPFSLSTFYCFLIGLLFYFIANNIPHLMHSALITIFIKTSVFSIFYLLSIYKFNISSDINEYVDKSISYLINKYTV